MVGSISENPSEISRQAIAASLRESIRRGPFVLGWNSAPNLLPYPKDEVFDLVGNIIVTKDMFHRSYNWASEPPPYMPLAMHGKSWQYAFKPYGEINAYKSVFVVREDPEIVYKAYEQNTYPNTEEGEKAAYRAKTAMNVAQAIYCDICHPYVLPSQFFVDATTDKRGSEILAVYEKQERAMPVPHWNFTRDLLSLLDCLEAIEKPTILAKLKAAYEKAGILASDRNPIFRLTDINLLTGYPILLDIIDRFRDEIGAVT